MAATDDLLKVDVEQLRWRLDPATLPFDDTSKLEPLQEIMGQKRGVQAFRFGLGMQQRGYNVFVTAPPGTGRLEMVKELLADISGQEKAPDDLCYVNNFKDPDSPILLRFAAGRGNEFKNDMREMIESLKREVPQLFESQEYISRKKEIMESYEKKTKDFFRNLDKKVKEEGFNLVNVPVGQQASRPELMPLVDGEPTPMMKLEDMVENNRFPKEEYDEIKEKYDRLKEEIDSIFLEVRDLQKELAEKGRKTDQMMFRNLANDLFNPLREKYNGEKVEKYLDAMLEDMAENIKIFQPQQQPEGLPPGLVIPQAGNQFQPYQVNLLVDNSEQKSPPVIVEAYPTYRNLFGGIERVVDRSGVWRTDFSKIRSGSFLNANGGYLVLNLLDLVIEPGVWPALKRALKTEHMEIQTFDPFYWFTSTGLKPEPIEIDVKVILLADSRLYHLLLYYDEDIPKIFKVRADFDNSMDRSEEAVEKMAAFIRRQTEELSLRPFDRTGVAAMLEHAVRLSGRQEKISISLPRLGDLFSEADYWAGEDQAATVQARHVDRAVEDRIYRSNLIEEKLQEMIDRGTLLIDADGEVVGQVNGLAVLSLGDYMFGRPTRITATTSMGKEGVINIEREAELGGNVHNKGVYILSGYLRFNYAQDKPLSVSASLAFEQSYSGVDGDSASSAELYVLLSSLAEVPLRQGIAVTGSVNQKGEIQAIGGVNQKIEGFYDTCVKLGLTGRQGVIIPVANIKDLMLRKDVVSAVENGDFHVWAIRSVDQGIELLTGREAGSRQEDGGYPEGTINDLVDKKLLTLARGFRKFGSESEEKEEGDY